MMATLHALLKARGWVWNEKLEKFERGDGTAISLSLIKRLERAGQSAEAIACSVVDSRDQADIDELDESLRKMGIT